jgi:hypothetical protein
LARKKASPSIKDRKAFRVDFPARLQTGTKRDRRIIDRLLRSEPTSRVAEAFDLSSSRVAQLRRQFHADWLRFGAAPGEEPSTTALL